MIKKLIFLLLGMLAVTFSLLQWAGRSEPSPHPSVSPRASARIGGVFNLIDHEGRGVSDADLRGRLALVFFGFTRCPDICPVSLANLSAAMEALGEKANEVKPVFITVDPAYDTPEVMKQYLSHFDGRIWGLTGSQRQIDDAAAAYKVYHAKMESEKQQEHGQNGHGEVAHSGYIYLMGRDGQYIRHFSHDASPQELVEALKEALLVP